MPPVFNGSIHSILPSVEFQLDRQRDTLEIERLAGRKNLQMVDRYTKSVQFEDSLRHYRSPLEV